ncbi:MAG: TetR/AcrR family transcriptional regulator [Rhodoglobus sp.]
MINFDAAHPRATRMKSEDRREQILLAATSVFGDFGYFGATTDQVAKVAGVSQPYVVRMFGTKEKLFLEVLRRSLDMLMATFRRVLTDSARGNTAETDDLGALLGRAYVELLEDRGLLLSLMHGFVMGTEPTVGPVARQGFLDVYLFLRDEAGFTPARICEFLASGMLLNTLIGLRMSDDYAHDRVVRELFDSAVPQKLDLLLATAAAQRGQNP